MTEQKIKISPSILSADFLNLEKEIQSILPETDFLHVDVMDGHFVPNLTIGPPIVQAIHAKFPVPLDVHIMVSNPDEVADEYLKAGANILTFHIEACQEPRKLAERIRKSGAKAGLSLRPATPLSAILPLLDCIDVVLVMSVNPGFGGQKFIPESVSKISNLKKAINQNNLKVWIEVDGGINEHTSKECISAGANMLVAGSYIMNAKDRLQAIRSLRS